MKQKTSNKLLAQKVYDEMLNELYEANGTAEINGEKRYMLPKECDDVAKLAYSLIIKYSTNDKYFNKNTLRSENL